MKWVVFKTGVLFVSGFYISIALICFVVVSLKRSMGLWQELGNGYEYFEYSAPGLSYFMPEMVLSTAYLLMTLGWALLGYVMIPLTFYWLTALDEILQYFHLEMAVRSSWLYEKAYALVLVLPVL